MYVELLLFQIGYGYINPGRCNDTLLIDIGSDHDIVITIRNQKRYTRATFISQSSAIVVKLTSCFHYFVTTGNMFILKMEAVGKMLFLKNIQISFIEFFCWQDEDMSPITLYVLPISVEVLEQY